MQALMLLFNLNPSTWERHGSYLCTESTLLMACNFISQFESFQSHFSTPKHTFFFFFPSSRILSIRYYYQERCNSTFHPSPVPTCPPIWERRLSSILNTPSSKRNFQYSFGNRCRSFKSCDLNWKIWIHVYDQKQKSIYFSPN